jgi:phytoene dehydrogenase-like protein
MKWLGNEQEVMVLGSGLGGLVAATLLSKNNHSVLLVREKGYQSSYSTKGYRFVPFSSLSEKSLKPGLVRRISQALSLSLLMGTREDGKQAKAAPDRLKQQRANLQVILPRARIDVFRERSLLQKEWRREFPEEALRIDGFYNELDRVHHLLQEVSRKKKGSAFFPFRRRGLIAKMFPFHRLPSEGVDQTLSLFSREFREFVQLQLISRGNFYSDRFPLSLATQILFDGASESNSDYDSERLEKEILNQFLRSGGRIEEIDRVKEVTLGWRKGFTLTSEGSPAVFRSRFFIINCPLHHISSFLGKKGKGILKWQKKIKSSFMLIPLFLGIDEKGVPVGMNDLLVSLLDPGKPYNGANLLFLSLSLKGDKTMAPAGKRALTVEGLMDVGEWGLTDPAEYQQRVMDHLHSLFPFLEQYVDFVDFQWARDHVSRWSYSHFLYESASDFDWREGIVPTKMSKRIYFVGKENFPYLGLGGEIFSGMTAAQHILKQSSRNPVLP